MIWFEECPPQRHRVTQSHEENLDKIQTTLSNHFGEGVSVVCAIGCAQSTPTCRVRVRAVEVINGAPTPPEISSPAKGAADPTVCKASATLLCPSARIMLRATAPRERSKRAGVGKDEFGKARVRARVADA